METTITLVQVNTITTPNTILITHQLLRESMKPATAASNAAPSTGPVSPAQPLPVPPQLNARNTNSALSLTVKPSAETAQDTEKLATCATWTMGAPTVERTTGSLVVYAGRVFSDI